MAYWNHFSDRKYGRIKFQTLSVGDKFRQDFWQGKRRRLDIICIKTGPDCFVEQKSKREHTIRIPENYECSSYS